MVRNSWSLERKGLVLDSSREFPALFEQLARQTSKLSWPKSQMPTTRPGLRTKTFSSAFDSVTLPLLRLVTSHPLQDSKTPPELVPSRKDGSTGKSRKAKECRVLSSSWGLITRQKLQHYSDSSLLPGISNYPMCLRRLRRLRPARLTDLHVTLPSAIRALSYVVDASFSHTIQFSIA